MRILKMIDNDITASINPLSKSHFHPLFALFSTTETK
jgi:hypothetical protein